MRKLLEVVCPSLIIILLVIVFILAGERFYTQTSPRDRDNLRPSAELRTGQTFHGIQLCGIVRGPGLLGGGTLLFIGQERGEGNVCVYSLSVEDDEFWFGNQRFRVMDLRKHSAKFVLFEGGDTR